MSMRNLEIAARTAFDAMVNEMAAELRRKDEEMVRSEKRRNELEAEGLKKDQEIEKLKEKISEMEGTIRDCTGKVKAMEDKVERKTKHLKEQVRKFNDFRAKLQQSMAALMETDPTISTSFEETITTDGSDDGNDGDDDSEDETTGSGDDNSMDAAPAMQSAQPSLFGSKISAESTGRDTRTRRRNGNLTVPNIPTSLKPDTRSARGGREKQPDGDTR